MVCEIGKILSCEDILSSPYHSVLIISLRYIARPPCYHITLLEIIHYLYYLETQS